VSPRKAELGHAEPLAADIASAHESGAGAHCNDDLRQQQHPVAVGIGEDENPYRDQGDRNRQHFPGAKPVEQRTT
jgi:hypothetical protein